MSTPPITDSADGTRPTTDGGTDNIGAGEKLVRTQTRAAEQPFGPAPQEHMPAKRTARTTRKDDSAPFGLTENPDQEPNPEAPPLRMPAP